MQKLCTIVTLTIVLFLLGCGKSELANCQQENQTLQSSISLMQQEIAAAKSAVEKKDKTIEDLRAENLQMQTKAMEGIQTMMAKQDARDKEMKAKLATAEQQNKDLQQQIEQLKTQLQEAEQKQVPAEVPGA